MAAELKIKAEHKVGTLLKGWSEVVRKVAIRNHGFASNREIDGLWYRENAVASLATPPRGLTAWNSAPRVIPWREGRAAV
jgi:hypothetical protein